MAITAPEHPTSPQINLQSSNNKVYIRRFTYARDDNFESEMPALNSLDATYGYFRGYRATFPNPNYRLVELIYDSDGTGVNFAPGDGDTEYWAETRGEEKPLEFNSNYLISWNYNLYGKFKGNALLALAGFNAAIAKTWATMTDLDDAAAAGDDYKVSKSDPGSEWAIIESKTKPAQEFYIAPQPVVFQRDYHRTQAAAEADLQTVSTRILPAEVFGYTNNVANWLCTSSNTQHDGKYWVTETEYLYSADGWDTDLYT